MPCDVLYRPLVLFFETFKSINMDYTLFQSILANFLLKEAVTFPPVLKFYNI
jgi:hypothetical protein